MAATTTTDNILIAPEDGWVALTPAAVTFFRTKAFPANFPYYLAFGASQPASTVEGFLVSHKDFWCNVALTSTAKVWARVVNPAPQKKLRIDVFYITSA